MRIQSLALTAVLLLQPAATKCSAEGSALRHARPDANRMREADAYSVGDFELEVNDVAAAARLTGASDARRLPASDSPLGAVLRLAHAYALGQVAEYGALLCEDFRLEFAEAELRDRYPGGFGRDDEMASLEHLVHGFTDRAGVERPAARSMRLRFSELRVRPATGGAEDRVRSAIVQVRAELRVTLVTGEDLGLFEGLQEFQLLQGDAASVPAGARADADHWYVHRWIERAVESEDPGAGTAPVAGRAEESEADGQARRAAAPSGQDLPEERPAGGARVAAIEFAVSAMPSPTSGPLLARVSLAESGDARLELMDVSGRQVSQQDLRGRGPGRFVVNLAARGELASGVYWVRLSQGPRFAIVRAVVVK